MESFRFLNKCILQRDNPPDAKIGFLTRSPFLLLLDDMDIL